MSESGGSRFRNPWVIAGLVLATITAIGLLLFMWQVVVYMIALNKGVDPLAEKQREASISTILAQKPVGRDDLSRIESGTNPMLGDPSATMHLVEFVDYECPFCKLSAPAVRTFMMKHPDVLLILRDFPLSDVHDKAMDAAIAARCVFAQGKPNMFWQYHDFLYQNQDAFSPTVYRALASNVGADLGAFDDCVSHRSPEAVIKASYDDGVAAGLKGTPTFFMNGFRIQGALDLATLEALYQRMKK